MTSFCRITGHARNMPKPCYFPLLPPISPADAKKLCRITGKSSNIHSFCPLVAFGKPVRFDGTEGCRITQFENFQYVTIILEKIKDNEKSFDDLIGVLNKMKGKRKKQVEGDREFIYHSSELRTSLIVSPEMEEAIRTGELESVSLSKDCKFVNIKIKQGKIVKMNIKSNLLSSIEQRTDLFYGRGQNKKVLEEQQDLLNERNKRKANCMARKERFEALDAKADADELRDTVKPAYNKPRVKFNAKQRAEKLAKMEAMMKLHENNKSIALPKVDTTKAKDEELQYERMLYDVSMASKTSVNLVICSSGYNWAEAQAAQEAFNWLDFPCEELVEPVEVERTEVKSDEVVTTKDMTNLDIIVSIETIQPTMPVAECLTKAIVDLKDTKNLKKTENVKELLATIKENDPIPTFEEINAVAASIDKAMPGYMVQKESGTEFVAAADYVEGDAKAISGAIVDVNEKKKFVAGQIMKFGDKELFVAGQTVETDKGKKFVPGQTVLDKKGEIKFVPGQCVQKDDENTEFVAGQIFTTPDGPKFVPGQMMDRGEGKEVFVTGQTITTDDGPKFSPGEVIVDIYGDNVFVPGLTMATAEGEKFITGQVFQFEEGVSFKPGQIMDTVEGPSFVPGKVFDTPDGKKFIKGDLVQGEDGNLKFEHTPFEGVKVSDWLVIPNKELQLVAVADTNVSGFIVNPTNLSCIPLGEKLYGDMIETEDTVQFYISGKLPAEISPESKVIPGQLITSEADQRFVPGKLMNTPDGEKFVPGQTVNTTHGEEFIPGQIVESEEGPKFVPGQLVMTSQGEKFVPGQVIIEEEGPKFVPGQIIQTKNGATFIPGQMMNTDEGQLFVPGQLVETNDGPRFVPGQVVESPEGPRFIPGTIIETDEGLKYVPPDTDEYEEDFEFSFQGFEVSADELKLLMSKSVDAGTHSHYVDEECLIDTATLKKLANTVVVHGVTPEPPPEEKKKKKKKRARVQLDADDGEKMEVDEPDDGTDKLDILLKLVKATTCVSEARKTKEMKKLAKMFSEKEYSTISDIQVDAMAIILAVTGTGEEFRAYFGDDEELLSTIVENIDDIDTTTRNDEAKKVLRAAIQAVVTKKCDEEIDDIIHLLNVNPDNLLTDTHIQVLLSEAVGVVCVTGNIEVASMLERFISEPSDPNELRDNHDVVTVLRQLLVLHQMSDRDDEVGRILQVLQTNPEGVKDRRKVRELLKSTNLLLKSPKEEGSFANFNIRHIASSKDIPTEIFEQIKEDRKEADKFIQMLPDELFHSLMNDKRCGDRVLDSLDSEKADRTKGELDKFKKGMAIVVTKENVQAVIPRECSRSICYGIMPYILIDEEGFKFFERGLAGRKLAPARVIQNTWYMPDSYYYKKPSFERTSSGEQYRMAWLGPQRTSAASGLLYTYYTSLLPSSGPTLIPSSGPTQLDSIATKPTENSLALYTSRAANIVWSDLDGCPLTTHRKGSKAFPQDLLGPEGDEGEGLAVSSMPTTKIQRHVNLGHSSNLASDLDKNPFIYRRATREEKKEFGENYSVMAFDPITIDETIVSKPICRSDTVANLLDKYSNFSVKREFSYKQPGGVWNRHKHDTDAFLSTLPDLDEDGGRDGEGRGSQPRRVLTPVENNLGIGMSREHSRSRTPRAHSSGRESAVFPREPSLTKDELSGRESQATLARELLLAPSHQDRFSNIYEEEEDDSITPMNRIERRATAMQNDDLDAIDITGPKGRPGGALERYHQRKAREAKGIFDEPPKTKAVNGVNGNAENSIYDRPSQPKTKHTCKHKQKDMSRNSSQVQTERDYEDPGYARPGQGRTEPGRGSVDPYGRGSADPYGRGSVDPYGRGSVDPYGRGSVDPYGRNSVDPYARGSMEPYGRQSMDPYGREEYDPYSRVPQDQHRQPQMDPYNRGGYDPYNYGQPDPYSRVPADPYGRPPPAQHGRGGGGQYGREYQDSYGSRNNKGPRSVVDDDEQDYGSKSSHGGRADSYVSKSRGPRSVVDDDDQGYGGYGSKSSHGGRADSYVSKSRGPRSIIDDDDKDYGGYGSKSRGPRSIVDDDDKYGGYGSKSSHGGRADSYVSKSRGPRSIVDDDDDSYVSKSRGPRSIVDDDDKDYGGYGSKSSHGGRANDYGSRSTYGRLEEKYGSKTSHSTSADNYESRSIYDGPADRLRRNMSAKASYDDDDSDSEFTQSRPKGRHLGSTLTAEQTSHARKSLTPRQEERNNIAILANKYLRKPLPDD